MSRFVKRPSAGTVIATIALFVALGGVAGALPGQNKVDNGDVKDLKYKNLNLINGWSDVSSSNYPPSAAIDAQGIVHLRGAVAQGIADGDTFAVLDKPLRPDKSVSLVATMSGAASGRVTIDPNGQMTAAPGPGGVVTAHKLFTSLDGVTYEAGK
jgi:hypothetical protein